MKFKHRMLIAATSFILVSLLIIDSNYNLKTTEYELRFKKLPEEFDGFKIVLLSDLHGMSFGKNNRILNNAIRYEMPDLIAITGDMVDDESDLPVFESLLNGISGIAPIYYITGNHEWKSDCMDEVSKLINKYSVIRLQNEYLPVIRNDSRIIIAGTDDRNAPSRIVRSDILASELRQYYPDDFALLLHHRNNILKYYPELPIDLILSGHAHGGIVRLPFIGGVFNVDRSFGATYEKGIYRSGNTTMLVSTGLGNSVPIPRFLNRPELVSITLHSAK